MSLRGSFPFRALAETHATGVLGGADILASTIDLFLVQAVIIIALTRILAVAGVYLKQPRVIFEVVGGILLGPSAIGRDTGYMNRIFPTGSLPYIGLIAEFGLILYLFLIGLELDPLSLASHFKRSGAIALVGMIIPFCLGVAISQTLFDNLMATDPKYKDVNFVSFFVFIGTAFAITAFPVLARILRETGLLYARAGALAMGAAALNDAVAWCLLILAISIANAGNMATAGYVFLCVCTFALGLFFVVRPAFTWLVLRFDNSEDPSMRGNLFAFTLIIMFLCAWTTDLLGVHSIFGAFLFGLIVPRNTHLFEMCEDKITDFVMTILLPLYFALSGLKTDVTQLSTAEDGAMVILVCVVATVGKLLGAGIPALMSGLPVRESAVVAVLMNTRGLVELIVLNLGIASGVLNQRVFTVMVIMCIFTTFLTCPVVYYIFPPHLRILEETKKNDDLEPLPQEEHELPEPPPVGAEDGSQVLRRFDSMALCVVVDKLEQLPALMQVLLPLAPSTDTQRLRVLAVRLLEPTYSDRDKFLYATEHGRLTSVESEATVVTRDDTSPRPELLSLSLFCRAIGATVDVNRVVGDTKEFSTEIKHMAEVAASDLLLMHWRSSQYNEMLFWGTLFKMSVPVVLVIEPGVEGQTQKEKHLPHILRSVIVLITFSATDVALLQMALKLLESKRVSVTVIVPGDIDDGHCSGQLRFIIEELSRLTLPNLAVNLLGFSHTSLEGYYRECSSNVYDMIMVSFSEPSVGDSHSEHRQSVSPQSRLERSRSRAGTLSAMVEALVPLGPDLMTFRKNLGVPERILNCGAEHPEFGVLVERLYATKLANYILLVHPPRDPGLLRKMSVVSEDDTPPPVKDTRANMSPSAAIVLEVGGDTKDQSTVVSVEDEDTTDDSQRRSHSPLPAIPENDSKDDLRDV